MQDYRPAENCSDLPAAEVVGAFLHHLWPNASLFEHLPSCHSKSTSSFKLFTVYNFSNFDKLRAIYSIFNGLPKSFQLMRCTLSSSKEDIEIFFDRINCFPHFQYLLLGVNLLSLEVQQVFSYACCLLIILTGTAANYIGFD